MKKHKVYTYDNPFALDKMSFWNEIREYPHLCVSQTLAEGLKSSYGRTTFTYISTIDDILKELYKPWTDQTKNKVEQFIIVSEMIRKLPDEKLKKSMFFNRQEVFESLRYLFEVQFNENQINIKELTAEQQELLSFYVKLKTDERWTILNELIEETDKDDLEIAYLNNLKKEIKRDLLNNVKKNIEWDELEEEINKFDITKLKLKERNKKKNLKEFYQKLLSSIKTGGFLIDKVVIHGVHQFNPMILQLVKQFETMGIEVVFLINYVSKYPRIFETWKNVYMWCTPEIKNTKEITLFSEQELGTAIGNLLHSQKVNLTREKYKILKFDNLSSACAHVGETFLEAGEKLAPMSEQFYAVSNNELNDVLKAYFPKHFKEKQFLSYPVGQFILALYNVWDVNKLEILIKEQLIKECLAVDFFGSGQSLLWIYEQVKEYFSNVQTVTEVIIQLNRLKKDIVRINKEELKDLKAFSFYNVSIADISELINAFEELNRIAKELFTSLDNHYINYGEHYKKLIEVIELKVNNSKYTSDAEIEMVESLKERFEDIDELNIKGNIEDLKETIHFYLQVTKENEDQAQWIVRNFEQLDGGILLDNRNKIHLMMVSNEKMNIRINDLLPWPLNEEFFSTYKEQIFPIATINLISKKEYKYFLRYSLFYATYYLKNEIIISYIENSEDDEKETLYFLMELLGFKAEYFIDAKIGLPLRMEENNNEIINFFPEYEDFQEFAVCGYRFFQNRIINTGVIYQNPYHFYHYYKRLLFHRTVKSLENKKINTELLVSCLIKENMELREFFQYQNETFFFDVYQSVLRELKDYSNKKNPTVDEKYHDIRKKYLMGQITDENNNKLLSKLHDLKWENNKSQELKGKLENGIKTYLQKGIPLDQRVNPAICQYCNKRDLCLNYFAMGETNE